MILCNYRFSFVCLSRFTLMLDRKPHVNVGTIGHVDHGKTTLTAAITKVGLQMLFVVTRG